LFSKERWQEISINICNRRTGIGADQLLLLLPSETADYRMRIFNSDGSEVEMCGNGIRCLGKYIWDNGLSGNKVLNIETLAGIIRPQQSGDLITVDMGEPKVGDGEITLKVRDTAFKITCVSMGNPHAVTIVEDVMNFPVEVYGPLIETHEFFYNRTNVEFVEIIDKQTIRMRVWERGAGETPACGTGACAAAVASYLLEHTNNDVKVILNGGELDIQWNGMTKVYMTGPAVSVFKGVIEI
jgi:diaminopimelate epimerase